MRERTGCTPGRIPDPAGAQTPKVDQGIDGNAGKGGHWHPHQSVDKRAELGSRGAGDHGASSAHTGDDDGGSGDNGGKRDQGEHHSGERIADTHPRSRCRRAFGGEAVLEGAPL